jgi:hypothetical protein
MFGGRVVDCRKITHGNEEGRRPGRRPVAFHMPGRPLAAELDISERQ